MEKCVAHGFYRARNQQRMVVLDYRERQAEDVVDEIGGEDGRQMHLQSVFGRVEIMLGISSREVDSNSSGTSLKSTFLLRLRVISG